VDCGICDKAGECTLQDYHYTYNGEKSLSFDAKVRSTKYYNLSNRILSTTSAASCACAARASRTRSRSPMALGVERRGDVSNIRPVEDRPLAEDPYSDNIVDLCRSGRCSRGSSCTSRASGT